MSAKASGTGLSSEWRQVLALAPLATALLLLLLAFVPARAVPRRTVAMLEERRLDFGLVGVAVLLVFLAVWAITR